MRIVRYYRLFVKQVSQETLADAVGIAQPKISQLENGKVKVGGETLARIADYLTYPGDPKKLIDFVDPNAQHQCA